MINWPKIFSALSDETRLRIFLLLLRKELCVCEIVSILGLEQSRISHSLKELYNTNLIKNRREGRWNIYFVNPEIKKKSIILDIKKECSVVKQDLKKLNQCNREDIRKKCKIEDKRNERKT